MKAKLNCAILRALLACDGLPMPESALLGAVRALSRPAGLTEGDLLEALHEVEARGFVSGASDELTGERSWILTLKGVLRAREA